MVGESGFDDNGCWLGPAGDVNGDGYADLITGAADGGHTGESAPRLRGVAVRLTPNRPSCT